MKEKIIWTHEKRRIDDLIENKDNPRRMSKRMAECLKASLKTYGQCEDIVIQEDGRIIGGHQRLKTLRALGFTEVDVKIPNRELSKKEQDGLSIILNKVNGDFDFDMLANRWDLDTLLEGGFTREELDCEVIPKENPKSFSINLKFENETDLRDIEEVLNELLLVTPIFKLKVKVK